MRNQFRKYIHQNYPTFRIFEPEEATKFKSIQIRDKVELWSEKLESKYKLLINSLAIANEARNMLSSYIKDKPCYVEYRLIDPTVYILKFSENESRWFLQTNEGFLLEDHINGIWDKEFYKLFNKVIFPKERIENDLNIIRDIESILWCPESKNFTHFLVDSIGPSFFGSKRYLSPDQHSILSSTELLSWHLEAFQWIGKEIQIKKIITDRYPIINQEIAIIKPKEVIVPLITHPTYRMQSMRDLIKHHYSICNASTGNEIIFSGRRDERQRRVINYNAIAELVEQNGGKIIYFSELNYSDKVRCLKNARLCIGESTGTLNPGLFAPDDCQILRLENPWTYTKRHLVLAHWTYLTGIADRTKIIYGQSNEMNHIDFRNSEDPLPQGTEYPINQIQKVIKDIAV